METRVILKDFCEDLRLAVKFNEIHNLRCYLFLVGAHLVTLRAYSYLCAQKFLLARGTIWDAGV